MNGQGFVCFLSADNQWHDCLALCSWWYYDSIWFDMFQRFEYGKYYIKTNSSKERIVPLAKQKLEKQIYQKLVFLLKSHCSLRFLRRPNTMFSSSVWALGPAKSSGRRRCPAAAARGRLRCGIGFGLFGAMRRWCSAFRRFLLFVFFCICFGLIICVGVIYSFVLYNCCAIYLMDKTTNDTLLRDWRTTKIHW